MYHQYIHGSILMYQTVYLSSLLECFAGILKIKLEFHFLGCLHILAYVNNAEINMGVQIYL